MTLEVDEQRGIRRRRASKTDWGSYGRKPVLLLALVALIDSVDRGILPGVLDAVQKDLGFSDFEAGLLGTAFVIAGFVVVLPAGYVADRYSRTRVIAVVLASWGVISAPINSFSPADLAATCARTTPARLFWSVMASAA